MTGAGDAGIYRCPRCGDQLTLDELLAHLEGHAEHLGQVSR